MKIEFSQSATNDLYRLKEFIKTKNPIAAERIINKLISGIQYLVQNPNLGIEVKYAPVPDSVRDIFIVDYHVRYLKLKTRIMIIRIWHQKEDR